MNSFTDVLAGVGLVPGPRLSSNEPCGPSADKSEPVEKVKPDNLETATKNKPDKNCEVSKLSSEAAYEASTVENENVTEKSLRNRRKGQIRPMTPNSAGGNDTESTLSNVSDFGPAADGETAEKEQCHAMVKIEQPVENEMAHTNSVIVSGAHVARSDGASSHFHATVKTPHFTSQRTVSPIIITSAATSNPIQVEESKLNQNSLALNARKESGPVVLQVKKGRRGRLPKSAVIPVVPDSPPSSPDSAGLRGENPAKRRKKSVRNVEGAVDHIPQMLKKEPSLISLANDHLPNSTTDTVETKDSSTPKGDETYVAANLSSSANVELLVDKSTISTVKDSLCLNKDGQGLGGGGKEFLLRNGMSAPHMLGNQLNPSSSVAQKMSDTLTAELEAHSVFTHSSPSNNR